MSKAAMKQAETTLPTVTEASETAAIISMLERVAADATVPIERMEQIFSFLQKVRADQARRAYDCAFSEMQPELPIVERKGKSHTNKYGRWEDIVEQIAPILAKHGFSVSFRVKPVQNAVDVTAVLAHREGHREETSFPYPYDKSGNKSDIHAIASATSYGKRYTASALLNIVTRDEDDDGHAAGGNQLVTDAQADELMRLIRDTNSDVPAFLTVAGVAKGGTVSDIRAAKFGTMKTLLLKKKERMA